MDISKQGPEEQRKSVEDYLKGAAKLNARSDRLLGETRECLAEALVANNELTGVVRFLLSNYSRKYPPVSGLKAQVVDEVAGSAVKTSAYFLKHRAEIINLLRGVIEIGKGGAEFGIKEIREIAKEVGLLEGRASSLGNLLKSFRELGAIQYADESTGQHTFRLGDKLL